MIKYKYLFKTFSLFTHITNSSYIELFLLRIPFSLSFYLLLYSWIGYVITINVAKTDDKDGINTIVYLMKFISSLVKLWRSYFSYADVLPIKNITRPAENLSNKLYIPKTKAPVFAFDPTTSDIKLIPVESTIVCEIPRINYYLPTKTAIMYITQAEDWFRSSIEPRDKTHMIVPVLSADFLPNFL